MKELTDAERLEIALNLLGKYELEEYERIILEHEQDCERNGFHNTPAECEDRECKDCEIEDDVRLGIDCPYTE